MATNDHQSYEDRPQRRGKSRSRRGRRKRPAAPAEPPSAPAGFALLADPATIAGATRPASDLATAMAPDVSNDLESSRRLDSPEIETYDEKWSPGGTPVLANSNAVVAENPTPRRDLLDAASARRLAADARARERASREALAATQRLFAQEAAANPPSLPSKTTENTWQRHPLVSTAVQDAPSAHPARESRTKESPSAKANNTAIDATVVLEMRRALAAARAEIREFESTLSIARDTTHGQKQIIAELRKQLDHPSQRQQAHEAKAGLAEPVLSRTIALVNSRPTLELALERADLESDRLRERLTRLERVADERDAEHLHLRQAHDEREALLAARNTQIDSLRDRFEAQDRALDGARREYELERARHSRSLEILARLRATLAEEGTAPGPSTSASLAELAVLPAANPDLGTVAAPTALPAEADSISDPTTVASEFAASVAVSNPPLRRRYGAVFDAWQDDQIRRHFGPMGIDTFVDLLRAPLTRRLRSGSDEQRIVLLGRGAWGFAARLTEGLVENGASAFMIHVGDPDGPYASDESSIPLDSPVRDYLRPFVLPGDPMALDQALEALAPSAIISRDFLSHESQVTPWLACLERRALRGACHLFSERTGVSIADPPSEMTSIGERIWELMPDRYTRIPDSDKRVTGWLEGFSACAAPPPNHLISEIRERFQLEAVSQFGFLAKPFLSSAISPNFDPHAPRDLRFLRQVADLDDRKIESGIAPALHFIGLVDPLCESQSGD